MENNVPIYKIIRNIATKGKEYEAETRDWLNEAEENKALFRDILHVWQVTGSLPEWFTPDNQAAWEKIRKKIHTTKKQTRRGLYLRVARIAASVAIAALCVWAGSQLSREEPAGYTEVISPAGQKTRVILPDSSIVLLNGESSIRYNNFNDNNRTIALSGEAWFDVRKKPGRQFIVQVAELNIRVFGTSFNVKAHSGDNAVEVGLQNGQVGIERGNKEIARLTPGEIATFDKDRRNLNIMKTDIGVVSAWTRDELVFDENTLNEIIKYMERWYGVEITIDPALLDGERFTFKVKTESIRELLDLINHIKPIKCRIEGEKVTINKP